MNSLNHKNTPFDGDTYYRGKIGCSVRETEVSLRSKRNMPFPGLVLPPAYQVMVSQYASDEHIDKK